MPGHVKNKSWDSPFFKLTMKTLKIIESQKETINCPIQHSRQTKISFFLSLPEYVLSFCIFMLQIREKITKKLVT